MLKILWKLIYHMTFDFRNNRAPAIDVDGCQNWRLLIARQARSPRGWGQQGWCYWLMAGRGHQGTPGTLQLGNQWQSAAEARTQLSWAPGNWYQLRWYTSTTTCPAIHCKSIVDSCPAKLCGLQAHFWSQKDRKKPKRKEGKNQNMGPIKVLDLIM